LDSNVVKVDPSTDHYDVQFSITSLHTDPLVLVKWNTPLDRLQRFPSDMFYIRSLQNGQSPIYLGVAQKRFPVPLDFVTINPNETLQVSLDLLSGYWFPSLGEYEVMFSARVLVHEGLVDKTELEGFESMPLASSPISVIITKLVPLPELPTSDPSVRHSVRNSVGGISEFINCSSTESFDSVAADGQALRLVENVNNYLNARGGCGSNDLDRYVLWFGVCDVDRWKTVTENFLAIGNRISLGYRMYCNHPDCSPGVYAYVYPRDPTFTVYVCSVYFRVPICSYDSKAGTIIHEISHFTPVAGTQDFQYGVSGCQQLARTNPNQAVRNADSCEYMAENAC